jgi:sugar O-acyltransferase (sialic acid O-acetyltransferase NeuD family)
MVTKTLVILGAGGHGKVVADAALAQGAWERVVATDRNPAKCSGELLAGVPLLPLAEAFALADAVFHVAIGGAGARRKEAREALAGRTLVTVTHPSACVSAFAQVEEGSFLAAQCVVAPAAHVGACVIVNHGAVVDHDVQVQEFSHVAPRAALGGEARIGRNALVGTGATVLAGVRICDDTIIGAGAVVRQPITEAGVYAGVPARRIR